MIQNILLIQIIFKFAFRIFWFLYQRHQCCPRWQKPSFYTDHYQTCKYAPQSTLQKRLLSCPILWDYAETSTKGLVGLVKPLLDNSMVKRCKRNSMKYVSSVSHYIPALTALLPSFRVPIDRAPPALTPYTKLLSSILLLEMANQLSFVVSPSEQTPPLRSHSYSSSTSYYVVFYISAGNSNSPLWNGRSFRYAHFTKLDFCILFSFNYSQDLLTFCALHLFFTPSDGYCFSVQHRTRSSLLSSWFLRFSHNKSSSFAANHNVHKRLSYFFPLWVPTIKAS